MISFKNYLLLEKIYGNSGWVYHRTPYDPKDQEYVDKGIRPSASMNFMYGRGLYCCYDLNEQLKPNSRDKYGEFILKGKIDLNGFVILDRDIFELANPRSNPTSSPFEKHLEEIGTSLTEVDSVFPYTSEIAVEIWKKCKGTGYNGMIFTGARDGKVAVIWNRRNFIPYRYTNDDGKSWKPLTPNISSIKRRYDPEYDEDDEAISVRQKLRMLRNKRKIEDLDISEYNGVLYLPELETCRNIYANNATKLNLPELETCRNIYANNATELNLPELERCLGSIYADNATELNLPKLNLIMMNISAEKARILNLRELHTSRDIHADNAEILNLPELIFNRNIHANNATELNLQKLEKCEGIHAEKAKKIIISKTLLGKLKGVPLDCEIIHPEESTEIVANENMIFKKYLMLKENLVKIDLDKAYEIFKDEYEKSTGVSWSRDEFLWKAQDWEFYGDDDGYVAIRRQKSKFCKLVGMAGKVKSKLNGINALMNMNLPLWGMVSENIKNIAVKRGMMREPNPLEREILKMSISPEILGGAEILEYLDDGGIKIKYDEPIGTVIKYFVGTEQYYEKLREQYYERLKKMFTRYDEKSIDIF